jgi:hypothetical protein
MLNGHPYLATPTIRANCVCKLLSTLVHPYRWEVQVWATEAPHLGERARYEVQTIHEQAAAQLGMERFSREIFLRGQN